MTELVSEYWSRAVKALELAEDFFHKDFDSAASKAYYAAFYAVTALFLLGGKSFKKHSGLRTALHREWVKSGKWSSDLGEDYDSLIEMRWIGDYGGLSHISEKNAKKSLQAAKHILQAVHQAHPDIFPLTENP